MSSTIYFTEDIHIFCNKIFRIPGYDDDDEEPFLILCFVYNVDGDMVDQDTSAGSRVLKFAECNPSSLRVLIEEKEPIPLDEMIDPQDAEILRDRISNIVTTEVHDSAGLEGLGILKVNVVVDVRLEEEDYAFMELDDAEYLIHERRMDSLQKNAYKNLATGENDNEICSICLNEMGVEEEVACTPCIQRFHHTCISRWLQKSGLCPLCRFKIDPH